MLRKISFLIQIECKNLVRFVVSVMFALSLGCSSAPTFAQELG